MSVQLSILIIPFIIGFLLVFLKIEAIHKFTNKFCEWIIQKNENILSKDIKILKFTLSPFYSLLIATNYYTKEIKNDGLKTGIRIATYLWVIGFFIWVYVIIGYFLLIITLVIIGIWLFFWLLGLGLRDTDKKEAKKVYVQQFKEQPPSLFETWVPFFSIETTKEKAAKIFSVKELEVNDDGNIFTNDYSQFPSLTKIGYIDEKGRIYDTRDTLIDRVGSIDDKGKIFDERENKTKKQ